MKSITIIWICLAVFSATVLAVVYVYDETNFNSLDRAYQPAPQGYKPGKDNEWGIGMHHPGESCC